MQCLTCRFWNLSECRRHAPHILSGSGAGWSDQLWPKTNAEDWCGEWEKIPQPAHEGGQADIPQKTAYCRNCGKALSRCKCDK